MFSFGRRDSDLSPTQQVLKLSLSSPKNGALSPSSQKSIGKRFHKRRNGNGRGRNGKKHANDFKSSHGRLQTMNVENTHDGVEISLDLLKGGGPASPLETREPPNVPLRPEPILSLQAQIQRNQRVRKSQFSLNFPANLALASDDQHHPAVFNFGKTTQSDWRPKEHRIPLRGMAPVEAAYEDVLNLLQHSHVADEFSTVHQEFELMNMEIEALESDKNYLQTKLNRQQIMSPTAARSPMAGTTNINPPLATDWDVQKLLDSARLTDGERKRLEAKRGNCFTICFASPRAKEVFLSKSGAKLAQLLQTHSGKRQRGAPPPPGDSLTLGPHNCRPGGAAMSVRQISLLKDSTTMHAGNKQGKKRYDTTHQLSGFFFSRDTGKAQNWGRMAPKLYRRLQEQAGNDGCDLGDLVYLSSGARGCYFARFRSGETWWGSAVEDDTDFHTILKTWDVYKVAFGPISALEDLENGTKRLLNSWIILGRDGRAAWKNLPTRLHNRLSNRLANWAAISEVSLGPGGSYFVRFLDGTSDYCLPASAASLCEYIERNGGTITEIALHPEISEDFLIRHSELR